MAECSRTGLGSGYLEKRQCNARPKTVAVPPRMILAAGGFAAHTPGRLWRIRQRDNYGSVVRWFFLTARLLVDFTTFQSIC
jgi:hypothetical protein